MLIRSDQSDIPHHGGRLHAAAKRHGIPLEQWLDLSTGINPRGWPVPPLPESAWNRLPEDEDGLEAAAREYYGTPYLLPVAGSQAAIQALPQLVQASRVALVHPGYAEYPLAWSRRGHSVNAVTVSELGAAVASSDVMVLANPNNPSGTFFSPTQLLDWHKRLAARNGWLIVDEAFVDATPQISLTAFSPRRGLIVLRSLGKFFGLAGARVGFVCAEPELLQRLKTLLGSWPIATPSRCIAALALADKTWQEACRTQLKAAGARLEALLQRHGLNPQGGCALFQWVPTPRGALVHERLAERGILTRYFDDPASLRFGLPKTEDDWARLDAALGAVVASMKLCP